MSPLSLVTIDGIPADVLEGNGVANGHVVAANGVHHPAAPAAPAVPPAPPTAETLSRWAWTIGESRAGDHFSPADNHAGLGIVNPHRGFAHWRIHPEWVERTAQAKGDRWRNCALVLRLYDVSFIEFNGFNAHSIVDLPVPNICGQMIFQLSRPGTVQLGEVGFRLRDGEFIPAARSNTAEFPRDGAAPWPNNAGLLVDEAGKVEEIGNVWDQERILWERRKPRLRSGLRIAILTFEPPALAGASSSARFIAELCLGKVRRGH